MLYMSDVKEESRLTPKNLQFFGDPDSPLTIPHARRSFIVYTFAITSIFVPAGGKIARPDAASEILNRF